MSDLSTNLESRPALAHGLDVVPIATMTDFPAPSAGVITLEAGKLYLIQTALVTADRFELPAGSQIEILGTGRTTSSITYVGTGTFFSNVTGTTINRIDFNKIVLVIANPAAKVFDITADASASSTFAFRVGTIFFVSGGEIGIVRRFGIINITALSVAGVSVDGLELNNCVGMGVTVSAFQGSGAGTATLLKISGPSTSVLGLTDFGAVPIAGESLIFISPDIGNAQINLAQVFNIGNGSYFKKNDVGQFSAITNSTTVVNIDSVTDSAGDAVFNAVAHGYDNDEQITHSGFSNPAFNGDFLINFQTLNNYEITDLFGVQIPFGLGDVAPGIATRQYRVFTVTTTVGLAQGTPIQIINTAQNNGAFIVRAVGASTSFSVPAAFSIDEAGEWTTDSLDETDPRIDVSNAGQQKESKSIALGAVNNNPNDTPVTILAYAPIDVSSVPDSIVFSENIVTERFVLSDSDKGVFTYTGLTTFRGFLTGSLAAVKQAASANYRFAMSLNGGLPLFLDIPSTAITSVIDSPTSPGTARFVHGVTVPVLSVGSFATITGFTGGNLRYNQKGLVTFANATNFEIDGVDFVATGTGNFTAPAAFYVPMEVKSTKVVIPLLFSAQLRTGDTIQLMVAGHDTNDDLTVTDLGFGVF